jgi:hypothetical protein
VVERVLIRVFTPGLKGLQHRIGALVASEADLEVRLVDHTELTLDDFEIDHRPVSIDRHLARKFAFPFVRVSRVFRADGEVVGRRAGVPRHRGAELTVIDTDICEGQAVRYACRILGTKRYSAPLHVQRGEDLIDVEDLVHATSLFADGVSRSYLCNERFFCRRTSLPGSLFRPLVQLVGREMATRDPPTSIIAAP